MSPVFIVLLAAAAWALALVFYRFFSPFGLGPAPQQLLGQDFFTHPAAMPDIKIYIDGQESFGAILAAMDRAEKSLHVQTFIWKDDTLGNMMVDASLAAANRGVAVKLCKDLLGSFFEMAFKNGKPSPLFNNALLKSHANINIQVSAKKAVDHSKYYIMDRQTAFFGGMNVADEYHAVWHDYMVGLHDPGWAAHFAAKVIDRQPWPDGAPFVIATNTSQGAQIRTGVIELIDAARDRLLFEHAYFSASIIIDAIERALARGVKVDLLLPRAPSTHGPANRAAVNRLLGSPHARGLRIFFYPRMTHAKALVADGKIVAIGSANMTPRSLYVSGETVMFAHFPPDHPFIARLNARMERDLAESQRITEPIAMSLVERARAVAGKYIW